MSGSMMSQLQGIIEQINEQRNSINTINQSTTGSNSNEEMVHLFVDIGHSGKPCVPAEARVFVIYQDTHNCGVCQQQFTDVISFLQHKLEHAFGKQMYRCELCGSITLSKGELAIHYVTHHQLSFNRQIIVEPIETDVVPIPPVEKMDKETDDVDASEANLTSPALQSMQLDDGTEVTDMSSTIVVDSVGQTVKRKTVRSNSSMLRRKCSAGGVNRGRRPAESKSVRHPANVISVYPCPVCGKIFRCRRYLRRHADTHGAGYACEICGKSYRSRVYLRLHRRRHEKQTVPAAITEHPSVPPRPAVSQRPRFSCAECDFTSDSVATTHAHHQVHAPSGSVRCAICGRTYSNRPALSKHRRVHDADRPYACPVAGCRWRFQTDALCRAHIRAHTVARRFRCSKCGFVFRRKHHLQRHEAKVHQPSASLTSSRSKTTSRNWTDNRSTSSYSTRRGDVMLSSVSEAEPVVPPSDVYDTSGLVSDDDYTYKALMEASGDICGKKIDNFMVDDLELFE